jgi:hypothetical protein
LFAFQALNAHKKPLAKVKSPKFERNKKEQDCMHQIIVFHIDKMYAQTYVCLSFIFLNILYGIFPIEQVFPQCMVVVVSLSYV